MVRAKFISTRGPYSEAQIEIEGRPYYVFDEFSVDAYSMPKFGSDIEFEFSNFVDANRPWEEIFSSNPEKKIGLEQIEGWKYRAFGRIIGINPVRVDCGVFVEECPVNTNDDRVVGEYIAFVITRLGGYAHAI